MMIPRHATDQIDGKFKWTAEPGSAGGNLGSSIGLVIAGCRGQTLARISHHRSYCDVIVKGKEQLPTSLQISKPGWVKKANLARPQYR